MGKQTWRSVPLAEKERLAALYHNGQLTEDEAATLGMRQSSLDRYIRDFIYHKRLLLGCAASEIKFPDNIGKVFLDYEILTGDDYIIISDIEIPDHSVPMLELALLTGMASGIKKLIIAGDLIATDQQSLNSWVKTWRTDEASYEEAVDLTWGVLNQYATWFDEIYIIEGNHDDRIARTTRGEVHLGMLLRGAPVKYSRYSHLWVDTSRGPVKIVHPKPFSQNPVTLGQDLYAVEPTKCHIVLGHCHRQQSGWTKDGLFEVHALGMMRDPKHTQYRAQSINKFPQWNAGFLKLQRGYFYPMTLRATDWKFVLGNLYDKSPLARLESMDELGTIDAIGLRRPR